MTVTQLYGHVPDPFVDVEWGLATQDLVKKDILRSNMPTFTSTNPSVSIPVRKTLTKDPSVTKDVVRICRLSALQVFTR